VFVWGFVGLLWVGGVGGGGVGGVGRKTGGGGGTDQTSIAWEWVFVGVCLWFCLVVVCVCDVRGGGAWSKKGNRKKTYLSL